MKKIVALVALVSAAVPSFATAASTVNYYVTRDARELNSPTEANPNFGALTFLYNHGDHFHSLGRVGGPEGRLPESYIGGQVLLQEGTGAMAGRFVSAAYDDGTVFSEYSNLEMRSIDDLRQFAPGTEEAVLLNSSAGRWSTLPMDGAVVALELVEISAGLHVKDAGGTVISSVGDRLVMGDGEAFSFLPTFFTDLGTPEWTELSAVFKLVDARTGGTPFGSSGHIRIAFQTVPEPGAWALMGIGAVGLAGLAARRRLRPTAVEA